MSHAASGESSRKGEPGSSSVIDALAHRQLALFAMALEILGASALAAHGQPVAELFHEAGEVLAIGVKFRGVGSNLTLDAVHGFEQTGSNSAGIIGRAAYETSSSVFKNLQRCRVPALIGAVMY